MSHDAGKRASEFPTTSDNLQKQARSLKFWTLEEAGLICTI